MLQFNASTFMQLSVGLKSLETTIDTLSQDGKNLIASMEHFGGSENNALELIRWSCGRLKLTVSQKQAERIADNIATGTLPLGEMAHMMADLRQRIADEMESELFFHISREMAPYYAATFSPETMAAFPGAAFDSSEAGKCIAVGRHTAAVFHLMRVVEHGLRALAAFLGVPHDHKNWDPIIKKMRAEVEDYQKSNFKGSLDFLRQTLDRLTALQTATRNEVMHARSFYDEERATEIYRAVKSFMQQLAERLKAEDA